MNQTVCYIGFGSNLEDRLANCRSALEALSRLLTTEIKVVSSLYETEPVYSQDQASGSASDWAGSGGIESKASRPPDGNAVGAKGPWFLNGVVGLSTGLGPEDLLARCQQIESGLGRPEVRSTASPRTIDLDILLYGEQVFNTPALQIPHPRMHERAFVMIPMTEIAPKAWHPVFQKNISQILAQLKDTHAVKRIGPPDRVYPNGGF